jgi:hypothetical protein
MAQDDDESAFEQTRGGGALVFGALVSIIAYLTLGEGTLARWAWVFVVVALVAAMKLLPPRIAEPISFVCYPVGYWLWTLAAALLMLVPGFLAYTVSRVVVETFPRWLQGVTLAVWFVALAWVSALLYSRTYRERMRVWFSAHRRPIVRAFSWRGRVTPWAGIALYINFVTVAMGCFAGLAFLFHTLSETPLFLPKTRPVEHGSLSDFLLWHLLDAIPGLKVPETIKWEAPLDYSRASAGWLVLLFKVMVIIPVVSGVGHYLRDEEAAEVEDEAPARRGGTVSPSE